MANQAYASHFFESDNMVERCNHVTKTLIVHTSLRKPSSIKFTYLHFLVKIKQNSRQIKLFEKERPQTKGVSTSQEKINSSRKVHKWDGSYSFAISQTKDITKDEKLGSEKFMKYLFIAELS